jgi:hypothetical protein
MTMKFNKDRNWLAKRAEQEDRHFISVGGLISRVGSVRGTYKHGEREDVGETKSGSDHEDEGKNQQGT